MNMDMSMCGYQPSCTPLHLDESFATFYPLLSYISILVETRNQMCFMYIQASIDIDISTDIYVKSVDYGYGYGSEILYQRQLCNKPHVSGT